MPTHLQKLWHFHGGLHLAGHKHESTALPIATPPLPARLVLPLHQHIGTPAVPLVKAGDRVLKGQMIARDGSYVSAPVHAPTSGVVRAIESHLIPHPSGLPAPCIIIDSDGRDEWTSLPPGIEDPLAVATDVLRTRVREAGIVGLGGAGFPTHVKLSPDAEQPVDTLVLNGAECEPYITCDDVLMRERAHEVVDGARIMRHTLHAARCLIGVEDNKPEACTALRQALAAAGDPAVQLVVVPTRYPTGDAGLLIKVLTGREVPSMGRAYEVGVVCHNVGTAIAVHDAVRLGRPLISRIVTATGSGVAQPCNFEVLFGTPIRDLITAAGGYTQATPQLLMGGPMMGLPLPDDTLPIIKTCNCVLVTPTAPASTELQCIRCGECVEVCPVNLLPQQLYWHTRARDFDKVQDEHLFDCIECGCCDYVCPSHIPLVSYFRYAKTEIWAQEKERSKADVARRRHEARIARLERDKAERAARLQKHKPDHGAAAEPAPDKAAMLAALEHAKAKQAEEET